MNIELERVIELLKQDINGVARLNPDVNGTVLNLLVEQALRYAYVLGKSDGYTNGVLSMAPKSVKEVA